MYPKIGNSIRVHAFVNWLYAHHDFDLISESAGWDYPRTELEDGVGTTIRLEIVRPFEASSLMISKCFFWILLCWMSLTYPRHIEYKKTDGIVTGILAWYVWYESQKLSNFDPVWHGLVSVSSANKQLTYSLYDDTSPVPFYPLICIIFLFK